MALPEPFLCKRCNLQTSAAHDPKDCISALRHRLLDLNQERERLVATVQELKGVRNSKAAPPADPGWIVTPQTIRLPKVGELWKRVPCSRSPYHTGDAKGPCAFGMEYEQLLALDLVGIATKYQTIADAFAERVVCGCLVRA